MNFTETLFDITKGTELEPTKPTEHTYIPFPDAFLEYNGVQFGIGMDTKLYIKENNIWRKANEKDNVDSTTFDE